MKLNLFSAGASISMVKDWIEKARNGDREALSALVSEYKMTVYGFIAKSLGDPVTAEDLTQEVFVKMLKNLSGFRGEAEFKTWLLRIAFNQVQSYFRWRKIRSWVSFEERGLEGEGRPLSETLADPKAGLNAPAEDLESKERAQMLRRAVDGLPRRQREIVLLRSEGLKARQIAEVLGVAVGTVKAHLFSAIRNLRESV